MARVPQYGQLKQRATPVATANFRSNASPAAFGAGIGRAMQGVARGINDLGNSIEAVREMDDAAIVDKQVNEYRDYLRDLTYNPETGYANTQGQTAVEGRGDYDKKVEEKRKELSADLTPQQNHLFQRKSQGRRDAALDTSIRHSAGQRKVWYNDTATSTLNGIADDAIAMSTDAAKFQGQIDTGYAEIEKIGLLNGWPEEKLKLEQERWQSGVHTKLIKGLAPKDPLLAHSWLSVYGKYMTNTDRINMENALAHPVRLKQADENAQRIMSGEGVEDTEVPMDGNPKGKIKILGNTRRRTAEELEGDGKQEQAPKKDAPKAKKKSSRLDEKTKGAPVWDGKDVVQGIKLASNALGPNISDEDLATILYFETAGSLSPTQKGPVTKWGRHRGYIQFGEPQAKRFGVDWKNPIKSQLGSKGAIVKYALAHGFKPGMDKYQLYAAINAGDPTKLGARDAAAGGTWGTVKQKVDHQMHKHRLKARMLLGGQSQAPDYVEKQLAQIKDTKLRAETTKAISRKLELQGKAIRTRQRNAKLAAEKFLLTTPDFNPTKLPLAIQQEIGIEGMTKLYNFQDLMQKSGGVKTDEELFLDLRRQQAEDPYGFAEDVDLFDHVDKLSVKDRRSLQQLQVNAIKDRKNNETKALTEGKSMSKAMALATRQLKAAGVIKVGGVRNKKENLEREAEFQRRLMHRLDEFQKAEKRIPSDAETLEMVDQLLTPIIIRDPSAWFGKDTDARLFDAPGRPDGTSVHIDVPYESIDIDVRLAIQKELAIELGREPTKEEIKAEYVEFVLKN